MRFKNTGIVVFLSHLKIYLTNGQGWVSDLKYPLLLAVTLKVYLPNANNIILGLIALVGLIGMAFIGWFDLKYIKLFQTIQELMTRKFNPYFKKLEQTMNRKV